MKSRTFRVSGLELSCLDYGGEGRPPLLFLHGGSAHAHWWDFTAPAFAGQFHALALDQRGHGDSQWTPQWAYGSRHYVADLGELIGQWGLGAPVLVGHSMGGHNALLYAARKSQSLRGIVVIDTMPDYPQRAVDFLRSFAARPPRRFTSLAEACAAFRLQPRETCATPEVIAHVAGYSFRQEADGAWIHKMDRRTMIREPLEVWNILPAITCPARIVKVTQSPLLGLEAARRMVSALPQGRLVEIGNSYHHVMLDNPRALITALGEFLRGLA